MNPPMCAQTATPDVWCVCTFRLATPEISWVRNQNPISSTAEMRGHAMNGPLVPDAQATLPARLQIPKDQLALPPGGKRSAVGRQRDA